LRRVMTLLCEGQLFHPLKTIKYILVFRR